MHTLDPRAGLEWLDRTECLRRLAAEEVGRLAVIVGRAPTIVPVNFAVDGEAVVFRTHEGTRLACGARSRGVLRGRPVRLRAPVGMERRRQWPPRREAELDASTMERVRALPVHPWAGGTRRTGCDSSPTGSRATSFHEHSRTRDRRHCDNLDAVRPRFSYAATSRGRVGYATFGDGPRDYVLLTAPTSHVDFWLNEDLPTSIYGRVAEHARVIFFDRRGTGCSDPSDGPLTVEGVVHDVLAVMDAAGAHRAILNAYSGGGPVAITMASDHPDRCAALLFENAFARLAWAEDQPFGTTPEAQRALLDRIEGTWGTGGWMAGYQAPEVDPATLDELARLERLMASPEEASPSSLARLRSSNCAARVVTARCCGRPPRGSRCDPSRRYGRLAGLRFVDVAQARRFRRRGTDRAGAAGWRNRGT